MFYCPDMHVEYGVLLRIFRQSYVAHLFLSTHLYIVDMANFKPKTCAPENKLSETSGKLAVVEQIQFTVIFSIISNWLLWEKNIFDCSGMIFVSGLKLRLESKFLKFILSIKIKFHGTIRLDQK